MTSGVKISIIVPIYNCELYIQKCLDSLFNQTLAAIEYIFVDDCGTDRSIEVIRANLANRPTIIENVTIVSHSENKGVASARNTGLSIAKGEYVGWVDADDWVEVDMFEQLYNKAKFENADIVWCDYINVYESNENYISQNIKEVNLSCIYAMMSGHLIGAMWNKLIRRELFISTGVRFPDGLNMCEDLRVNIQLFYFAGKISYLEKGLYHYVKYKKDSISVKAGQEVCVNIHWIENVKGILDFIEMYKVDIDQLKLDIFKLVPKKNLLVKGHSIRSYKIWSEIFPESNYAIQYSTYPFVYKSLAYVIDKEWWFLARIWIYIKYGLLKK